GGKRPESISVRVDLSGQGHGEQGAAVKAVVEGNNGRPACRSPGDLDRVLDSLCTAVEEEGLLGKIARGEGAQPPCQLHVWGVHGHRETGVDKGLGLAHNGLHDPRMTVPYREGADSGGEVDVDLAVHIRELSPLATRGEDRDSAVDAARQV